MAQEKFLFNKVEEKIEEIKKRIESYKKLDASITKYTLMETLNNLEHADNVLEKGFVNDSCKEIDEKLKYN